MWIRDDGGRTAAGLRGRAGDCVVRALAVVADIPYRQAMTTLTQWTRTPTRGARVGAALEALRGLGWRVHSVVGLAPVTVQEFVESPSLATGRYLLLTRCDAGAHLVGVRDGRVHDTWDCRALRVEAVWTLTSAHLLGAE